MPRGKRVSRRRLQAAVAGLYTNAAAGAVAARIAKTYKGPTVKPPKVLKVIKSNKSNNLRGSNKKKYTVVRRHANTEGYIPGYSKVYGSSKTSLSLSDKVQRIMNPPQTLLYNLSGKIDASSGTQTTVGFSLNNSYFNDFFAFIAALRSDVNTVSNSNYASTQVANRANHHWTSIMHTFMNSGNLIAELDIYIYEATQDIDSNDQAVSALSAWQYGEQINGANGIAVDGTQTLGKKPLDFSSKLFINRYWRLISVNSVTIKPGENYKHYFRKHYNRQIAQYMLNADTAASIKKHSLSIIYVLKGQVVGSSLDTGVSTGDAQISYIRQIKTQFGYAVNQRARDMTIGTSLPVIPAANQIFMNTDTSTQLTGYQEDT